MARNRVVIVGLLVCFTLTVCGCSGVKSQILSRATAIKIINQNPKRCGDPGALAFTFQAWMPVYQGQGMDSVGAANKAFIDAMVAAGVVTIQGTEKANYGSLYKLAAVKQDGVAWDFPNIQGGSITLELATARAKEVTRMVPDEDITVVDVVMERTPTPLYQRSQRALRAALSACADPTVQSGAPYCMSWPKAGDLTSTISPEMRLFRSDKGWGCRE